MRKLDEWREAILPCAGTVSVENIKPCNKVVRLDTPFDVFERNVSQIRNDNSNNPVPAEYSVAFLEKPSAVFLGEMLKSMGAIHNINGTVYPGEFSGQIV